MASKRGLSIDEKRKRMIEFFHEKQEFFQLKDIEKLCSVEKGITLNTIKDVLQSLVDDGSVDTEKISGSVYYWSLPSKALKKRQEQVAQIEKAMEDETARNEILKKKLERYQSSQPDDEETRKQLEGEHMSLTEESGKYAKQLNAYKENDPQEYERMKQNILMCKKACNRWTENIFAMKSWLKNKFSIQDDVIDKQFEIPADLDYVS